MKSTIHISSKALQTNFLAVQSVAGDDVEVLAVVKANAYGHGAELCAPVLAEAGARWLGVSDASEGVAVRGAVGSEARILVMCGMEPQDSATVLAHQLTLVVWTTEHVNALNGAARELHIVCSVHLEIDTGMARQGVAPGEELERVLDRLTRAKHIVCEGVMTHLCCAESAGAEITVEQQQRFAAALGQVSARGIKPEYIHIGNSSAVDEGSTMGTVRELALACGAKAMVRTGFALYGHLLAIEGKASHSPALQPRVSPALRWTTHIIGMREVPADTTVGYGASFLADRPMRLALLPVGYADGFRRAASSGLGNGWVMIAGQRANVVGRVSMNLTVVDVTAINNVNVGDEVVLLGESVTAEDHASWSNTIAYDILCGLRGKRLLLEEVPHLAT